MSSANELIELEHINYCSYFVKDDADELRNMALDYSDLQQPEFLPFQDTFYYPDDLDETHYIFSDHSPGGQVPSDGTEFELNFHPDETRMHVHINTPPENKDEIFKYYLSEIQFDEVLVDNFSVYYVLDCDFDSLTPLEESSADSELTAFRVTHGGDDFSFAADEDQTRVRFNLGESPEVSRGNIIDYVDAYLEQAEEYLSSVWL